MKIGIFGGAFNPPHRAHIQVGKSALRQLELDRLIYIPTGKAPHKNIEKHFNSEQRFILIKIAAAIIPPDQFREKINKADFRIQEEDLEKASRSYEAYYSERHDPRIEISSIEIEQAKKNGNHTYTIDTVNMLKDKYQNASLFLIIGSDQAREFDHWKQYRDIMRRVTICYALRDEKDEKPIKNQFPEFIKLDWKPVKISSTEIRNEKDTTELKRKVPDPVYYLCKNSDNIENNK